MLGGALVAGQSATLPQMSAQRLVASFSRRRGGRVGQEV